MIIRDKMGLISELRNAIHIVLKCYSVLQLLGRVTSHYGKRNA